MPESLRRTWLAIALAACAVLFVGVLAGRAFVRDVFALCPGSLEPTELSTASVSRLEPLAFDQTQAPAPIRTERSFSLRDFQRRSVRVVWTDLEGDGRPCTCGSVPIRLSAEKFRDLRLYRVGTTNDYVVKGRVSLAAPGSGEERAVFRVKPGSVRTFQPERVVAMRHGSMLVTLGALGALVIALLRSRRATSYALRIYTWTEARLTPAGLIEDEGGIVLGSLEQSRGRLVRPGPVLVAPEALSRAPLYRDLPVIARRSVAEGSHAQWTVSTMRRLRDARVLAVLSTACTLLAFGARLMA